MREAQLAAIAVLVGIAGAGALVWGTLPRPSPSSCGDSGVGTTPLGGFWALGPPDEQFAGSGHWYNFSVRSVGGGLELRNIGEFQIQTGSGSVVSPGPSWTLTVLGLGGAPVGAYALTGPTAGNWTAGGDRAFTSGQTIVLFAGPQNLSGDSLTVYGTGLLDSAGCPFYGSVSVAIP